MQRRQCFSHVTDSNCGFVNRKSDHIAELRKHTTCNASTIACRAWESQRTTWCLSFSDAVTVFVTEANRHHTGFMLFPSVLVSFSSPPEFSRHANPTTQQTQLTNDYKNIITAFGFPTAMPLGTVVTAWWESSHVLIPVGFLSSSWLESLLSITDVFLFFLFQGGKQSDPPKWTIMARTLLQSNTEV